ncbi:hypothetical protein E4U55_006764 [Claviceps digitariae]|nr:hypothetical protein E4U55_006764 [Claviceps digitariae]
MTRGLSTRRSCNPHEAAPPPYEAATGGADNDNDGHNDNDDAREHRPFISYSDERQTQVLRRSTTERPSEAFAGHGAARGGGGLSSQSGPSKSTGQKWSSTPTLLSSILPSIPPGHAVLRARCFATGASQQQQQQLRVALATSTTLQVYDARRDALLWELHGNSSQLVQGNEEPLQFGEGFRPSPDGRLLCVVASRGNQRQQQRRLLIVDTETGWVRLEYALSATDGNKPHFSEDNSMVVVLGHADGRADAGPDAKGYGYFKIFSLEEGEAHRPNHVRRRIRFEKPAPGQAMAMRFAPDCKHLITCAGPTRKVDRDAAPPSISVCVYSIDDEADRPIRCTHFPCSSRFFTTNDKNNNNNKSSSSSSSSSSNSSSSPPTVPFSTDFHFPTPQGWLVSFPDYTTPGPPQTCLVNARLGQLVAILPPPQLSLSQKWQAGVSLAPPPQPPELAYDPQTGLFTRMDVHTTMLSRSQTTTLTKFALSANGGREKAVLRKALQIRAVVLSCRAGDVCALSSDGLYVLVRRGGGGGAEAKMDVFSVGV